MKRDRLIPIFVFLITALAFWSASGFGLAPCDDSYYVAHGPFVKGGLTLQGIAFALTDVSQGIWMPLPYISYMADYTVGWGYGGMHVQNIVWHGVNAVLLYLLLVRLFGSRSAAVLAALLWSIHPLRVESVVWIASRKDVISTCFLLCALHAWIRAERMDLGWLVASVALFASGLAAKPSVMVFPVFALALDFLVTGKRKDERVYYALGAISIAMALFANWCQGMGGATQAANLVPLWYRILNALAAVTVYLGNTVWPDALALQCMIRYPDPPRFSPVGAVCLALILLGVTVILLTRLRRYLKDRDPSAFLGGSATANAVLAGLVIYFGSLVPFLGIAGFGVHAFADRFTILPALGLSLAMAKVMSGSGPLIRPIPFLLLPPLAIATHLQTQLWGDNLVLMRHTLEVDRAENSEMQRAIAVHIWENQHDMEEIYRHLHLALQSASSQAAKDDLIMKDGNLLIEACYETGHDEEAEDLYYAFRKLNGGRYKGGSGIEFMMAEVLSLLHSKRPDSVRQADDILDVLNEHQPDSPITAYVDYLIAKEKGDADGIAKALRRCAMKTENGVLLKCHWAREKLAEKP